MLISLRLTAFDDNVKAPAPDADLMSADDLFRAGKFAEAETSYQSSALDVEAAASSRIRNSPTRLDSLTLRWLPLAILSNTAVTNVTKLPQLSPNLRTRALFAIVLNAGN